MTKVRWGIVSTADIGINNVTPAIQKADNCEVVAIASRKIEDAQAAATRLDIPTAYGSYQELIGSDEIDAVYIPLPNHLHAEWTMKAAAAGKHVLCEKPLAMTASQAREMAAACSAAGVRLAEAFMYRHHPSWVEARRLIDDGAIGELRAVQTWFSFFNDDPDDIRNIAEYGGGAMMDIGCYAINLSRMLFGAEPNRIEATLSRDPRFGVDILTSAMLEFPGGGQGSFTCSTQIEPDQQVHIAGTSGHIDIEIPFNMPPDRETRISVTSRGDAPRDVAFPAADVYTIQAELFAQAIVDNTDVAVPIEDAIANMEVIDAILATG